MANRIWRGVRMRQAAAGADPDAPPRPLVLPASWDDRAAAALAALVPGEGRASLPDAAESWIKPVAARARMLGQPRLADALHALLLARRAAPTAPVWTGTGGTAGFVLNLAAFHAEGGGLDVAGLVDAVHAVATALRLLDPAAPGYAIALSDLDGLLARLGLDYAGEAGCAVAANIAALVRGVASVALAGGQPDMLARLPPWPAPPPCPIPELEAAAQDARDEARRGAAALPCTAILPPGPADALLGVETGGIGPAFSPVDAGGRLTSAAQARLAAAGLSPEAALARLLAGETVLEPAPLTAYQAMHDAVAPYIHAMPPRPEAIPGAGQAPPPRRELPARHRGFTQKASVGGHRVFLRTGEYADGTLGEVQISLPREGAAVRGLVDAAAAAMSVGLQHGVPLQAYVDALALGRFPPAGAVEGDPAVAYATSVLDYAVRTLAHAYLGHCTAPEPLPQPEPSPPPLLPLDLPKMPRRAGLRLVARR
jgi:ribonucleoside-diphosphate reductase alpha chain